MKIEDLMKSQNIAEGMDDGQLQKIGLRCKQDYDEDKTSRTQWETWYAEALKLALQVKEKKTFPWVDASNVKFPLLTIAALNFHAKAYPAIISGDKVVKQRVIGTDPDGSKQARADRVSMHMSYQVLEEMPWEEQQDKGLLILAILGTIFKKTLHDNGPCSDLVMPQDLVVNYYAQDINTARSTHIFPLSKNELYSNYAEGIYRKPDYDQGNQNIVGPLEAAKDKAQKLTPPENDTVSYIAEQCCLIDLDEDGYEEPYFVTFHRDTGFVYRVLARYLPSGVVKNDKGKLIRIRPELCWTKYELIPSPDGGFYGMGLGLLLGPLNASVDTLINQLIDAGTMSNLGGGFLGRGVRMKAGESTFKPFEWKTVDSTGDNLRNNVVPLEIREPSSVLMNLLTYLVGYGERLAGSGDIQMGELPGQNVKAETMRIADENGRLIFNAIFKRIWRAMHEEFKKLYRINELFISTDAFKATAQLFGVTKDDYSQSDKGICPAADPNIVSTTQKREQAQMLYGVAKEQPGHDMYEVVKTLYESFQITGIDRYYPDPKSERGKALQPGPSVEMLKLQVEKQKADGMTLDIQNRFKLGVAKAMNEANMVQAEIEELKARAVKETAEAKGVDIGHVIALLDAQIAAKKNHFDTIMESVKFVTDMMKGEDSALPKTPVDETMTPPPALLQAPLQAAAQHAQPGMPQGAPPAMPDAMQAVQ